MTTDREILTRNRELCGFCQQLQKTRPGEWCNRHEDAELDRADAIQGLRELADFLEAHPTVPFTPHRMNEFVDTREEWDALRAAAPSFVVIKADDFFVLRKVCVGRIGLDVNVDRPREDDDSLPDNIRTIR